MNGKAGRLARALWISALLALSAGCERAPSASGKALLFPGLDARQQDLDRLQLRGAGNAVLVTLVKNKGTWGVAERGAWPADAGRVSQYLFVLSQSHRVEAKTANPALYSRLGVESITGANAAGTELTLSAAKRSWRLLIGHEHAKFDSNYVRVDGQAQAWLTDLPLGFDRDPAAWLDRSLVDLPLARVAEVRVSEPAGTAFRLSPRDDRFRLDDAPSAAMHDSHHGDALAGLLDQLRFDEVAVDDGGATAERSLQFSSVDGLQLSLQAWHAGGQLWVRLHASVDEARATAWAQQAGHAAASEALRKRVGSWNQRFQARRFQVPTTVAVTMMLSHEQILSGTPGA